MGETVASRTESGFDIIQRAMELLVNVYNSVPVDELSDTSISLPAEDICEILEMFFAYVGANEDLDIQDLMDSVNMKLSSTVLVDDNDEPKIH